MENQMKAKDIEIQLETAKLKHQSAISEEQAGKVCGVLCGFLMWLVDETYERAAGNIGGQYSTT